MNEPTTVPPTEAGTYLFCGSRYGKTHRIAELVRGERVEVVHVRRHDNGRIMYIGLDFFHEPTKAIGVWVKITAEAAQLKEQADALLLDQTVRTLLPPLFRHNWGRPRSKIVAELVGPFTAEPDKTTLVAEKAFDRAVVLGLLIEDRPGEWKLASG